MPKVEQVCFMQYALIGPYVDALCIQDASLKKSLKPDLALNGWKSLR
jgi:hypothetical protein